MIDGTERRQRPHSDVQQRAHDSGKKKAHTDKNLVVANRHSQTVVYLSPPQPGRTHDMKLADEAAIAYPPGASLGKDTGFQGYEPLGVVAWQPKKAQRSGLNGAAKALNHVLSGARMGVEPALSGVKRCRIVKDQFRNIKVRLYRFCLWSWPALCTTCASTFDIRSLRRYFDPGWLNLMPNNVSSRLSMAQASHQPSSEGHPWRSRKLAIVAILLVAAVLRIVGIAWGTPDPQYSRSATALGRTSPQVIVHPDAFHFAARSYLMVGVRDFNPHFFENPSFYTNLNVLLHLLSGDTAQYPPVDPKVDLRQVAPFTVYPMARLLSALAGMLGVAFTYATARRLCNIPVARLAALLLAVSFADVQHAHYATTNVMAGGLLMGSVWASLRLLQPNPQRRDFVLAGALIGLAGSTKYNVGLVGVVYVLCAAQAYWRNRQTRNSVILGLVAVGTAFWVGTPYSLFAPRNFIHDFQYITSQYLAGQGYPETSEALPLHILYGALLGIGPPAAVLTLPGLWAAWRSSRPLIRRGALCLVIFLAVYAVIVLRGRRLGDHLVVPVLGLCAILAAAGAVWVGRRFRLSQGISAAGVILLIAVPLAYSLNFDRLLTLPDTRQLAQAWIYAHIPRGAHVHLTGPYNVPLDSADYVTSQTFGGDLRPLSEVKEARGASVLVVSDAMAFLYNSAAQVIPGPYAARQNAFERRLTDGLQLLARFERPRWPGDDNVVTTASLFHDPTITIYCLVPGCSAGRTDQGSAP